MGRATAPGTAGAAAEGADAADVELALLRQPHLRRGGQRVALSRKDAALLAVLALDGACARQALAAWLWPDALPATAGANLRQRRFRLARGLGLAPVEGEDTLRLSPQVAHAATHADRWLLADPAALDGELLEGLSFDDCPELERWLQPARERWRVLRAQALARVASALEAQRRIAPALVLAERLAAQEPLSDHACRRLMRLHHLRGDLGAALAAYQRLAERLAQELGEWPDDETAALAAQLRQGAALPRAAAPLPAGLQRPPRLVGRDAAWQALARAWDAGADLLLEGAPGMGKSRLLADFLRDRPGVLRVPARPGDAERPYALLARVLGRLWFDPGAPWPDGATALPGWARRELAALLPELGEAPPRLDPLRLQRAVRAALRTPPGAAPLRLVALDDVQQADAATLELLPALAAPEADPRPDGSAPADGTPPRPDAPCWWLAVRQGEQPAALQAWMSASAAPTRLGLPPLDAAAVQQLLDDVLPRAAQPDSAALQRYTGGIPLFVLETLRSLHEWQGPAGPAAAAGAEPAPASATAVPPRLLQHAAPAGAAAVVQARLQHLGEAARQLAAAAAALDGPLALADAAALLGSTPRALLPAQQALQAAQWLDAEGHLHDLVRSAVLQHLAPPVRAWLHGRAAALLQDRGAPALEVARQWLAAGLPAQAAPQLQAAALAARRRARPLEEAALWERAIAAYEQAGQGQAAFGAWRESIESRLFTLGPSRVREMTAALLQRAADPPQQLQALLAHAQVLIVLGEVAEVQRLAAQAQPLARRLKARGAEVLAAQLQATALAQRQALPEALQALDRVRPLLAAAPEQRYPWLSTRSWVLHRAGRFDECARVLARAIALAEQGEDRVEACTGSSNMASLLVSLGRYDAALAAVQRALALRAQLGPAEGVHHASVDLHHGYVLLGLGRVASAVRAIERALQAFEQSSSGGPWVPIAANALAGAELMRGRVDAAAARLVAPNVQTPPFVAARHLVLRARIARLRGLDPAPLLAQAEALLGPQGDLNQRLAVQAERLLAAPGADTGDGLQRLSRQALQAGHGTLGARLGWLAVERLLATGDAAAAAALCVDMTARAAPRPIDLLPSTAWGWAAQAFDAAGDARRADRARRRWQTALAAEAADTQPVAPPG